MSIGRALQGASQSRRTTKHCIFPHRIPPRRKTTLVKLTRPLWTRCALPSDSYAKIEPLEGMAYLRRFTRRASSPWAHGCIGRLPKFGYARLSQITGVSPFFSSFQEGRQANMLELSRHYLDRCRRGGFWCHPPQNILIRKRPAHSSLSKWL